MTTSAGADSALSTLTISGPRDDQHVLLYVWYGRKSRQEQTRIASLSKTRRRTNLGEIPNERQVEMFSAWLWGTLAICRLSCANDSDWLDARERWVSRPSSSFRRTVVPAVAYQMEQENETIPCGKDAKQWESGCLQHETLVFGAVWPMGICTSSPACISRDGALPPELREAGATDALAKNCCMQAPSILMSLSCAVLVGGSVLCLCHRRAAS